MADGPDEKAYINSLGVVQYRLGRYEEALATLARSDVEYSKEHEGGVPADIAFIALAHHKLGHEEESRAAMKRLREVMAIPATAALEDSSIVCTEAEAMLGDKE